jgi:hypothetical protein
MSCPGLTACIAVAASGWTRIQAAITIALGSALGGVVVMVNLPIKAVTAFPPGCQPRL